MKKIHNLIVLLIPFLSFAIIWLNYQFFDISAGASTWNIYLTYWACAYIIYYLCLLYLLLLRNSFQILPLFIGLVEFLLPAVSIYFDDLWFVMFLSNLGSNSVMCISLLIVYFVILYEKHPIKKWIRKKGINE